MQPAGAFCIRADHPSLPGHFPGRPVVPGVLLLQSALDRILADLPGMALAGISQAKFLRAVLPGQPVTVDYEPPAAGRLRFLCTADDRPVLRGTALLRPA